MRTGADVTMFSGSSKAKGKKKVAKKAKKAAKKASVASSDSGDLFYHEGAFSSFPADEYAFLNR